MTFGRFADWQISAMRIAECTPEAPGHQMKGPVQSLEMYSHPPTPTSISAWTAFPPFRTFFGAAGISLGTEVNQ